MEYSTLESMRINRGDLLARIKVNRGMHRDEFERAQVGYRQAMIEELDRMLADAREGRGIKRGVSMPEPQDHTESYDTVIHMLEMCVDDVVEISMHEFDNYVRDNWQWKQQFSATNSTYSR